MKIEIREYAGISEMAAPEGYYLTQAALEPDTGRIFCTRRILLPGEQVNCWRLATAEEKERYEAEIQEEGQISPPHKIAREMTVNVQITADGTPVVATPLPALSELCALFLTDPASGGWSIVLLDAAGAFAAQTQAEAAARPDGLELRFDSPSNNERLALVLTVADSTVIETAIEYRGNAGGQIVDEVMAHSDCALAARVEVLETLLDALLSGREEIPELQIGKLNLLYDTSLVLTGEGAPKRTPGRAGLFYIDTSTRTLYFSTGNLSVADWKPA